MPGKLRTSPRTMLEKGAETAARHGTGVVEESGYAIRNGVGEFLDGSHGRQVQLLESNRRVRIALQHPVAQGLGLGRIAAGQQHGAPLGSERFHCGRTHSAGGSGYYRVSFHLFSALSISRRSEAGRPSTQRLHFISRVYMRAMQ